VHHNRNLHACREPLHAAQKAWMLHVRLRWQRKSAKPQYLDIQGAYGLLVYL